MKEKVMATVSICKIQLFNITSILQSAPTTDLQKQRGLCKLSFKLSKTHQIKMVTSGKKRKSTTNVNEPQKKSPKINKGKEKPTPPPANKKIISPVSSNKAKGKLQKKGATPKVVASKVKLPLTKQKAPPTPKTDQGKVTPKAEKKVLKKTSPKVSPKLKKEQTESVEQKISKSTKARILKKRRMGTIKEKAAQGDQEMLTKIKGVIKRIEGSGQKSKHSHRKLVQYKNLLALYSKDDKSTPKKTKKALKKSA